MTSPLGDAARVTDIRWSHSPQPYASAFDESVQYAVHKAGNWKTTLLGGEGLVTRFTGPGRLWMQTRSSQDLIDWIISHLPRRATERVADVTSA